MILERRARFELASLLLHGAEARRPGAGEQSPLVVVRPELDESSETSRPRRLCCSACGRPVTSEDARVAIAGQHVHHCTNPAGLSFVIGCFAVADGARVAGTPTAEATWFHGFTWVYSLCGGCGAHLGWFFEGGGSGTFHGLILDRLNPDAGDDQGGS
jgi:hypothetical protein